MNVLILGASGQVGTELVRQDRPPQIKVYAPSRGEPDFASEDTLDQIGASRRWAWVIDAAAYAAVDNAKTEVGSAWRINALAPALLAAGTAKSEAPVIHMSTDCVFDCESGKPYRPENPITTWCGLAREIMAGVRRRGARAAPVEAIAAADFGTKASRPANSALATDSLMRDYATRPRPWQDALEDVLGALLCSPKMAGEAK